MPDTKMTTAATFLASLDARRPVVVYIFSGEKLKNFFFSTENMINPKVYHPKNSKKLPFLHLEGNASFSNIGFSNSFISLLMQAVSSYPFCQFK